MKLFPAPIVSDNEIRYCFFLPAAGPTRTSSELLQSAEQQCRELLSYAAQETKRFLWHKHAFHLEVTRTRNGRYILSGSSLVGDAIQDEWVVAKLVFDITNKFPGVVGRIVDSDGELLLIESAEALPDWVNPEHCDRRVFVLHGKLHLAPPAPANRSGKEGELFDDDALEQVLDTSVKTKASAAVQQLIQRKLDQVPAYMRENRQAVRCLLPEKAARVIAVNKHLVGPAVEAFYYREPKQAGLVCGKMATFMPAGEEVVEVRVTFSRAMFAQLKQQTFFPPKVFLRRDARYHVKEKAKDAEAADRDAQAGDLGVKLACGLELLYIGDSEDQLGKPWKQIIEEALQQTGVELSTQPIEPDDDDSWLYIHPDTMESRLERAAQTGDPSTPGVADDLQRITSMFGKFVDGESGVGGVDGAEPVHFDVGSFMNILSGQNVKREGHAGLDAPWGEHFMDEDEPSQSDSDDGSVGGNSDEDDLAFGMTELEAELAETKVAKSFGCLYDAETDQGNAKPSLQRGDATDDEQVGSLTSSSAKPLDLDYNLLSNLLESFASQEGHPGPVSTILNEMGFSETSL
ncbi:unnamed protein product [Hyaloperonospora brassicae]|uniref:Uncharacterized protein n=1 Tax=Hyaloperonospora brassicae TaxID=162125 RepID=A0AAV0TNQ7_HYABA|nr:unnamed protein product [Hyaloperonospora brassicae]